MRIKDMTNDNVIGLLAHARGKTEEVMETHLEDGDTSRVIAHFKLITELQAEAEHRGL